MLILVGAIAIPAVISLQKVPQLSNTSEEIISAMRLMQNQTLASEGDSQYGIYFNTSVSPHKYITFKGSSYSLRDSSYDKNYVLPSILEFYAINTGANNEVVFDKLTGATSNSGNVSLRLKDDTSKTKIIYISNSGVINYTAPLTPQDNRLKDSRHIDFNYSRVVNTASENLTLTFNDNIIKTIPLSQNLNNGQFDWQGTYTINGTDQVLSIHTLRLNFPDTQFSLFRDARFNNASLKIQLSGDATGTLAEYSANGQTTNYYSIYVNNFAWQ